MTETKQPKAILVIAWITVLLVPSFKIIMQEIFHLKITENQQLLFPLAFVGAGLLLSFLWKAVRPLWKFFSLFLLLLVAQWFLFVKFSRLFPVVESWLRSPNFSTYMLNELSLKLVVTIVIIIFLALITRNRKAFFLTWGDTSAPAEPVKWLGVKSGERWNTLGRTFAIILSLGTLAFLVIAGRPPLLIFERVLPFIPAILLAAALNAFNEELTFKASFLSVLENVVGKNQALWLMAAYFGIFHFYGVPYGIIGVILAGFLGWFLGKSMLETRGLFWAWFLHFLQDVLIFCFLATGFIFSGG